MSILDGVNLVEFESKELRGMDIFYITIQSLSKQGQTILNLKPKMKLLLKKL